MTSTPLPPTLQITHLDAWKSNLLAMGVQTALAINEPGSSSESPQYTITLPKCYYGDLILSDSEGNHLATSSKERHRKTEYHITLSEPGLESRTEVFRRTTRSNKKWRFAMKVDNGQTEYFEWRRSKGELAKDLAIRSTTWYLVRLSSLQSEEVGGGKEADDVSDGGVSSVSDSHAEESSSPEVVALWTRAKCWKTIHGVGELQLKGAGATGELGAGWSIMALMSCLSIWQKTNRDEICLVVAT
ncbi:hypothetical protein CB0940_06189 [Cercospora beticola]|uniref:Uncharacterized protein n=1 Tax=Cercospora beticola TaxID=122368 RepID=A0A2G5HXG1_CERBT|nr:hypothetical protein CB0940_06189 [Cercospora beticola]PIA97254.1 hypothetical protein CB0940_06189 [Cercospora beticola]WPA98805.1 hypothetical protein RHO25_003418 [Cercospora beticola]CAK1360087.1 unnamed protein product [Cercospora beticola]